MVMKKKEEDHGKEENVPKLTAYARIKYKKAKQHDAFIHEECTLFKSDSGASVFLRIL